MRKLILLVGMLLLGCLSQPVSDDVQAPDQPSSPDNHSAAMNDSPATNNTASNDTADSSSSSSYVIVDTGQDKCYDSSRESNCPESGDFFGQDAQYQGNIASYQDNNDGTVTDLNTGLMWQRDPGDKMEYYAAVDGADSFTLAGYDDWRVPTIKELYSLMDFRGLDPSGEDGADTSSLVPFINDDYFSMEYGDSSQGERVIDSQWVTSSIYESTVMGGQECFFGVNFADGRIKCYPTRAGKGYFAIYVRGNQYGQNNFLDNGDRTITDNATGLLWQKEDSKSAMDWKSALLYCEGLDLAGEKWRLPNAKELQSIVDYSRSPDTTGSAAIDPVFEVSSITNEAGKTDYPFFWSATTHANGMGGANAAYVSFGRALGYMGGQWMDVHGAGAQRSDPKDGDPGEYPSGHGPQGDAIRIYNYVRCVSGGADFVQVTGSGTSGASGPSAPPQEAVDACEAKDAGQDCSFNPPSGAVSGICKNLDGTLACVPS